jgi:hypothetical protein
LPRSSCSLAGFARNDKTHDAVKEHYYQTFYSRTRLYYA